VSESRTPSEKLWLTPRLAAPDALGIGTAAVAALAVLGLGLASMGFAGMVGLADWSGAMLVVVPLILLGALLSWLNERVWISIALLGHFVVFLSQQHEGIGVGELGFTALTLAGLCVWLFKEMVIHRRMIVRTGFDAVLVGMFVTTTVVSLVANRLHEGEFLHYVTEWTKMFDLLLYFPVRAMIRTRRDVMQLAVLFSIVAVATGIVGVLTYRERLMTAVFAYQIEHSRVFTNEPVSMLFSIFGAVVVAYAKRFRTLLLGMALMTAGMLFLAVTFSRGAIASTGVGLVFIMIFSGRIKRLIGVFAFALILMAGGVYLAFPSIARTMAKSVGQRIGSIGSTMTDVSFNLRVIEANTILDHYVPYSPWIGYGYGVNYHWYDPTSNMTMRHSFIHNGYVRLLFKYGYPLAIFFVFFLFYPLLRLLVRAPSKRDPMAHAMMVGCAAYLVTAIVNNYVSDMFSHYAGPLNYALCWAILDYVNRRTAPAMLPTASSSPLEPMEPLAAAGV
jgi:O-antigen ligase